MLDLECSLTTMSDAEGTIIVDKVAVDLGAELLRGVDIGDVIDESIRLGEDDRAGERRFFVEGALEHVTELVRLLQLGQLAIRLEETELVSALPIACRNCRDRWCTPKRITYSSMLNLAASS